MTSPTSCSQCGKTDQKLLKCAKCHFARYCGKECQQTAWPTHKSTCRLKAKEEEERKAARACWDRIKGKATIWQQKQPLNKLKEKFASREELWEDYANTCVTKIPELLQKFLDSKDSSVVLDIGCGGGPLSIPFLKKGWEVEAYDPSQGALMCFSKKAQKWIENGMLKLHQKDVLEQTFQRKFTLIIANDVFGYLNPEKLKPFLETMHGALAEDGKLFGSFFIYDNPVIGYALVNEMGGWLLEDREDASRILKSTGFHIRETAIREDKQAIEFIAEKMTK